MPTLLEGLERLGVSPVDVRDVLVTHIHLDHAGAAGWWARQGARVHVHPVGAPHLVDPARLLASSKRIYGEAMDSLWGEVLPAPADRVLAVEDGAMLEIGGLHIEVMDTPGHARHHHVYRVGDAAFTGDAAGIRLPGNGWIDLPAPPPEFDLDAWRMTLDRLRRTGLHTLYRTHFGPVSGVDEELSRFERVLQQGAEWIREMLERGLDRERMIEEFSERTRGQAIAEHAAVVGY